MTNLDGGVGRVWAEAANRANVIDAIAAPPYHITGPKYSASARETRSVRDCQWSASGRSEQGSANFRKGWLFLLGHYREASVLMSGCSSTAPTTKWEKPGTGDRLKNTTIGSRGRAAIYILCLIAAVPGEAGVGVNRYEYHVREESVSREHTLVPAAAPRAMKHFVLMPFFFSCFPCHMAGFISGLYQWTSQAGVLGVLVLPLSPLEMSGAYDDVVTVTGRKFGGVGLAFGLQAEGQTPGKTLRYKGTVTQNPHLMAKEALRGRSQGNTLSKFHSPLTAQSLARCSAWPLEKKIHTG